MSIHKEATLIWESVFGLAAVFKSFTQHSLKDGSRPRRHKSETQTMTVAQREKDKTNPSHIVNNVAACKGGVIEMQHFNRGKKMKYISYIYKRAFLL